MMKMVKNITFCFIAIVLCACNATQNENKTQPEPSSPAQTVEDINMDVNNSEAPVLISSEQMFSTLIADPEAVQLWRYKGEKPCVIDFFATWCRPCAEMAPIYEALAKEYSGKIIFYKVDVDQLRDLSLHWGIAGMPTLLYCNDKGMETVIGYQTEEQLRTQLNKLLQ